MELYSACHLFSSRARPVIRQTGPFYNHSGNFELSNLEGQRNNSEKNIAQTQNEAPCRDLNDRWHAVTLL